MNFLNLSIILILISLGCKQEKIESNYVNDITLMHTEFLNMIVPNDKLKRISDGSVNSMFVIFNGECSSCIISFLSILKKLRATRLVANGNKIIYISLSNDLALTEYSMKSIGLELCDNEYLIKDSKQLIKQFNPFLKEEDFFVILTDSNSNIVYMGNRFDSKVITSINRNVSN